MTVMQAFIPSAKEGKYQVLSISNNKGKALFVAMIICTGMKEGMKNKMKCIQNK